LNKMQNTICPKCGNPKKPWFELCFDCNELERQKPMCEVCGKSIPEGHYLCTEHWKEKQEGKKKIEQIDYVKDKKIIEFKEKFEGKYYSPFGKVKSKSELLIAYFLHQNGIKVIYEMSMQIGNQNLRPDFVIDDDKGNTIILEHFGSEKSKEEWKIPIYLKFCKENAGCFFIRTNEEDIYNLKDTLGMKFNKETPLKKAIWK